jgi:DNA-binding transcriptional LysR family regulator
MVRAGAGVAIVPRRGAGVSARYGGLAVIPTNPEFSVHVTLVRHMRTMSPAAESYALAIRNHLLEAHGSS